MKTFSIQTLGCKVNHYESDQIAHLLTLRGLIPTAPAAADLRVVNTCSVTVAAARQSRQSVRRVVRLPQLSAAGGAECQKADPSSFAPPTSAKPSRVLVTGCWATSDFEAARVMPGVDAVIGHHDDVARELDRLLSLWRHEDQCLAADRQSITQEQAPGPDSLNEFANGWIKQAGATTRQLTDDIKPLEGLQVNGNLGKSQSQMQFIGHNAADVYSFSPVPRGEGRGDGHWLFVQASHLDKQRKPLTLPSPLGTGERERSAGTQNLPLLGSRQENRQRAYLKIQDGCDAHCTYCIIPSLRPKLWSKPIEQSVREAQALVEAGHVEIVLTGIFLGAYNQPTALRRHQPRGTGKPLAELIEALCTAVPGLRRLRLSSLEPGDLDADLLATLRSYPQVVPHFHLPLQSGSDLILRRMNRQYTRDVFLEMVDRLNSAFDRPALTTDIVAGFPGEDDAEFEQTADLVRRAGFIHVHAFPYSPRPGTAAARWTDQFIHGPVVNWRIEQLQSIAAERSLRFRESFAGQIVEVIVERDSTAGKAVRGARHGRCERYFDVIFDDASANPGDARKVRVTHATADKTFGEWIA